MQSHTMELPRLIEIGEKNIDDFGKFLNSLTKPKKVSLISGITVQKVLKIKVEKSLKNNKIQFVWHTSIDNQIIGDGSPGPLTRELHKLYWDKHDDPKWSISVKELV